MFMWNPGRNATVRWPSDGFSSSMGWTGPTSRSSSLDAAFTGGDPRCDHAAPSPGRPGFLRCSRPISGCQRLGPLPSRRCFQKVTKGSI